MGKKRLFIILFSCLLFAPTTRGQKPLIIGPSQGLYQLGPHLSYYIDKSANLTFQEVLPKKFTPLGKKTNFGFSDSAYWLKIVISNPKNEDLFFTIRTPFFDFIEFHKKENSHWETIRTGDKRPFFSRRLNSRFFSFKIRPGPSSAYLIKIKTTSFIPINMTLEKTDDFLKNSTFENIIFGFFFGLIATLFFSNLLVFFFTKKRTYILYTAYLLSYGTLNVFTSGLGFQLIYPNIIWLQQFGALIFTAFAGISGVSFLKSYLNIEEKSPYDKIIKIYIFLWPIPFLLLFTTSYFLAIRFVHFLVFLGSVIFILLIKSQIKKRSTEAQLSLYAFSFLLTGAACQILYINNILPGYFIFRYGIQIGGGLQVLIFSLGLAYSLKLYQQRALKSETLAKEAQEKSSIELKKEVERQTRELKKKNDRLKEYDFLVAHDLMNPIGAILSYTEVFEMKEDPTKAQKTIENIKNITLRAIGLIDGFLKVVTSGDFILRKHSIDIIIKWSLEQLSTKIETNQVEIKKDLRVLSFFCDETTMEQIFTNIIDNAIKYQHPDKSPLIQIKSWEKDTNIFISFQDNGIGIPENMLEEVFEKNMRIAQEKEGHGIGLYSIKKLVEGNKGQIKLESGNQGTTVTLTFPVNPT